MNGKRVGAVLLCCAMLALAGCGREATDKIGDQAARADGLEIRVDSLSAEPRFVDWTQDGVAMQLIALRDAGGEIHLALNTCQVCAGSPFAYFEYEDGLLVCQNCGNAFSLGAVGQAGSGCNPLPMADWSEDGEVLRVSGEALARNAAAFKNWKVFQ